MATAMASGLRSPPTPRSSAPSPRPSAPSPAPRPTFDADLLRAYMKELLQSTLRTATWPEPRERDKVKAWIKEIGERVKKRMLVRQTPSDALRLSSLPLGSLGRSVHPIDPCTPITQPPYVGRGRVRATCGVLACGRAEIQPREFKYIVLTQINENAGQGGR
ncbi:hypothetical protein C8Q76DRAFT_691827 [Earliella scabrosa]|nr:hypothetical protein C8Q76DRAFT_691827 [Earliella scabrosa]